MTTTAISVSNKSHSLSSVVRGAYHVRAWLSHGDSAAETVAQKAAPRRSRQYHDQSTMLTTFGGRYGARY